MIPEHHTYCEVFAGAGWVFFRKEPSRYEVINDLDGELVAFFRVIQNHLEEFLRQFRFLLSSREWFDDFKRQQEAGGLTDIQKAARYYYLQRQCFGGKVKGRSFGGGPGTFPRINLLRMEEELSSVHLRLARVMIENLDWKEFVRRYDKPDTFFYLDPPYFGAPTYNHNFESLDRYEKLAAELAQIKGTFILSINDVPEIRKVFSAFALKPVTVRYCVNNQKPKKEKAKELLVFPGKS
jgi:DNA adenine methylase